MSPLLLLKHSPNKRPNSHAKIPTTYANNRYSYSSNTTSKWTTS